ncbi:MAG: hypothetical protein VX641_06540 [Planctomycetota bacterium]|nr:hypothetical protein [Planctomycetota bacterium]
MSIVHLLLCSVLLAGTGRPNPSGERLGLRDRLGEVEVEVLDLGPGGVRILAKEFQPGSARSYLVARLKQIEREIQVIQAKIDQVGSSDSDLEQRLETLLLEQQALQENEDAPFEQLVPWDRVRSIEGFDDPVLEAAWLDWQPIATDLWRARTRLQRGDRALAAPLFEEHFERVTVDSEGSELGLIVAEGLLRSRLSSGAIESLLPAALEVVRLRRAGHRTDRFEGLPSIVDEAFWLVPQLAPIPTRPDLDSESMRAILRRWLDHSDPVVAGLARAYSALHDSPRDRVLTTTPVPDAAPGPELVRAALRTGCSDPSARGKARESIRRLLSGDSGDGCESWRGWFLGTSLLFEEPSELDPALIELLSVPALHLDQDPALALRAITLAAAALDAGGRIAEAEALRQEIQRLEFPVPPALQPKILSTPIPESGMVSEEETR